VSGFYRGCGKRAQFHGRGGRFQRPPSLEALGLIWICPCGGINTDKTAPCCGHCEQPRAADSREREVGR
jgi:hypothetical protein